MKLLQDYLDTVVNGAKPGGTALGDALTGLDELSKDREQVTDPKLRHYLENRSYRKAYDHLRGMATEAGNCGKAK